MARNNRSLLLSLSIGIGCLAAPALAQQFVYTVDWVGAAVYGYSVAPGTGALIPVPSSPFSVSSPLNVAADPKGRFLFITQPNAFYNGPNQIAVFTIDKASGAIAQIPGSPFPGGSQDSIAIHPTGRFAYTGNFGLTPGASAYSIDASTGALTLLQQISATNLFQNRAVVDPTGKFLYLMNQGIYPGQPSSIFGYSIDANAGTLTAIPGSPFAADGLQYLGLAIHPSGKFLYVADSLANDIGGYAIDPATGALTPVAGSPFVTATSPQSVVAEPSEAFVYVLTGSSITTFKVDLTTGSLAQFSVDESGVGALGAADCTGRFLYGTGFISPGAVIYAYSGVRTGILTAVPGSPFPQGRSGGAISSIAVACIATGPVSFVSPLPSAVDTLSFPVQWSGTDSSSPIVNYTIYVSDNGGPFTIWLSQTTVTMGVYTGVSGHRYSFYSIAQDMAGNVEGPKSAAEATTLVDTTPPVSHVSSLPPTETSTNFLVQWSGTDTGSGVKSYTIYSSDNGGPFAPWQTNTSATQAWYSGFLGHTYGFFSQATDVAGNQENLKSAAEAITQTPAQSPEDVNGDGQINCADVDLVKTAFGTKTGQVGFNPAADVNKDGVVNVLDLALVTHKLVPGTVCQ